MERRTKSKAEGARERRKSRPERKRKDRKAYSRPSIEEMDVTINPVMFAPSATAC